MVVMRPNKRKKIPIPVRVCICVGMLTISLMLMVNGLQDLKTMVDIQTSISKNQEDIQKLKEEQEDLEKTKQNLKNPDYIEYIARGKYLVTKEGEQVFKFPSSSEQK